jgi:2-(1,2-epoxy-1,2-dihydrophenyl)acetyl-CoA isomerase
MSFETVRLEIANGVATLALNRPDKLNALSLGLLKDLHAATKSVIGREDVRALVVTGTGRAFSSGADLVQSRDELNPNDGAEALRDYFNPTIGLFKELPIPTVAAVNGAAAGAGMSLALSCDIVVAARSSYFMAAFVNVALVPDTGASFILSNTLGHARATALMMLGERLPAEKAHEWGLIWSCVPDEELMSSATALAVRLAQGPTKTYGMIRRLMRDVATNSLLSQVNLETELQLTARASEDFTEAKTAFGEKRKPQFRGR